MSWQSSGPAEADALLDQGEGPRQEMRRLRSSILGMETKAVRGLSLRVDLLARVQRSLGPDTILLSFHLGEESSRLWAVARPTSRYTVSPDAAI